jgi:hypothetical protein
MSLTVRRWLFASFVIIFFIMAGLILPYALGYQFNGTGLKLQKTGMFVIDTEPSGARIYLNSKLQTSNLSWLGTQQDKAIKSPTKISHQLPGTYQVRLELDGYWPWEKELQISAGETTYLEDVRFFKQNLPQLLSSNQESVINSSAMSSDNNFLAFTANQEIKLLNLKNNEESSYPQATAQPLSWSSQGKFLLNGSMIIDTVNQTSIDLEKIINQKIKKASWSSDNDSLLCLETNSGILQHQLSDNKTTLLLSLTNQKTIVTDCMLKDGNSYLLKNSNSKSILSIIRDSDLKEIGSIELPRQANYHFANPTSKYINIIDANSQKLSIIETNLPWSNNYNIDTLPSSITLSQWINNDELLTASNFEIAVYNTKDKSEKLLTRVSSRIQNVFWHPSKNYVIFVTDQGVYALELDNRDRYNITRLLDQAGIQDAYMDQAGENLYFIAQLGSRQGYWQLEL